MLKLYLTLLIAKLTLFAIDEVLEKKKFKIANYDFWGTITDESGRTLSGQTVEAFLNSVSHVDILSIGFNCALGTDAMYPYIEELSRKAPFFISAFPNAGLPNVMGEYDDGPSNMAKQLESFMQNKIVNIIGGCCGTTAEHIKAFYKLSKLYKPRKIPVLKKELKISGLEAVTVSSRK